MARKPVKKVYAYLADDEKEVVSSWEECKARVEGRKARYRGFATRREAEEWLAAGAPYGEAKRCRKVRREELPEEAVYFDSGTGRGVGAEINVSDRDGVPLLHLVLSEHALTPRGTHILPRGKTNNFGELLACYHAIRVARSLGIALVCGDSSLVLDYWSKGHVSNDKRAEDPDGSRLADRTARERRAFESEGGSFRRIPGGINPADLGFHRD